MKVQRPCKNDVTHTSNDFFNLPSTSVAMEMGRGRQSPGAPKGAHDGLGPGGLICCTLTLLKK